MRKIDTDEFIRRSKIIYGDRYDYSLVDYIDSHKKIKIICKEHGIFEQLPYQHLQNHGCPYCAKNKKNSTENFIKQSNFIHSNRYDYSLVDYINQYKNVKIICKEHGIFEQTPKNHLNGSGCPKCVGRNLTFLEIEKRLRKIHGDKYEYFPETYVGKSYKLKMRCRLHNFIFEQYVNNHLRGWACPKCSKRYNYSNEEFKEICKNIHNDKYDYSLTNYTNANTLIKIICPKHGIFEQISKYHISGHGCPTCNSSKGELVILNFLKGNKIDFISQKRFDNCRDKYVLPFDFYLIKYNMCIEYQGRQHFDMIVGWGGKMSLDSIKKHDEIKYNFCKENKINLLIIRYDENIIEKLKEIIFE